MRRAGFTLIEFLVVLGVLTVAVGSLLVFLTSTLKGSNQSRISGQVKQNGQAVLDTLENQIRNARDVVALTGTTVPQIPNGASSAIHLTLSDGSSLFLICVDGSPNTNGWIGTATTYVSGDVSQFTSFTDRDNLISGVSISCVDASTGSKGFEVVSASGGTNPPVVSVSFDASQSVDAPSRQDFSANLHFQTTISLRNYEF